MSQYYNKLSSVLFADNPLGTSILDYNCVVVHPHCSFSLRHGRFKTKFSTVIDDGGCGGTIAQAEEQPDVRYSVALRMASAKQRKFSSLMLGFVGLGTYVVVSTTLYLHFRGELKPVDLTLPESFRKRREQILDEKEARSSSSADGGPASKQA